MSTPPGVFTPYDLDSLPAPVTITAGPGVTANQLVTGSGLIILIAAANNTATVAARWQFYDGTDTTGQLLPCVSVPGGGTATVTPASPGILFRRGIYVNRGAGTIFCTITYIPLQQILT